MHSFKSSVLTACQVLITPTSMMAQKLRENAILGLQDTMSTCISASTAFSVLFNGLHTAAQDSF